MHYVNLSTAYTHPRPNCLGVFQKDIALPVELLVVKLGLSRSRLQQRIEAE
jgi:hypothetical protein